ETEAALLEPRALLAGRELEVRLCPLARPRVFVAVETRRPEPVLARELEAVFDTEPALFGRVDEEQAAERPPRLSAEARLGLLLENGHSLASVEEFASRDEASEARSNDDGV